MVPGIPTIDIGSILKLAARRVCSRLFKSGISLLVAFSVLLGALGTAIYNAFDFDIIPIPNISPVIWNFDESGFSSAISYCLALDVGMEIVKKAIEITDKVCVFSFVFLASSIGLMLAYRWSATFKKDVEALVSGVG